MSARPDQQFEGEIRPGPGRASRPARVRFDVRGLIIASDDHPEARLWPYRTLRTMEPIPARASRITVGSAVESEARLTVSSPLFVQSLARAAPRLAYGYSERLPWFPMVLAALALLAIVAGLAWAVLYFLPYRSIAATIPDASRVTVGEITIASLTKDYRECKAATGQAALDKLVGRLAAADREDGARRGDRAANRRIFRVVVVDWDLINAFAVMGNQIVLTRGLISGANAPDEVAGVLAHAMGHAIELHPEMSALRSVGTVAVIQILIGGWSHDLFTHAGAQLLSLRHSHAAEEEADEIALRLLREADISPSGLVSFFERHQAEPTPVSDAGGLPGLFASHPPLPGRAQRAAAGTDYPMTPALGDDEWQALRNICDRD